jgi:hypothetical protein
LPRTRATIGLLVAAFVKSTHLPVVPSLSKAENASMGRMVGGVLVLVLGLSLAAGQQAQDEPATPAGQYKALLKEYHDARADLAKAKTDEQRKEARERRDRLPPRFLILAEKYSKDPIVVDALFDMVWFGMPGSDQALALLQRDHTRSDRLLQVRTQTAFGLPQDVTILDQLSSFFSKEGETFLRTVLDNNPHRDVQAQACLALARFYLNRANRLALLKERPELTAQYEKYFGKTYLNQLQTLDPAEVRREAEALLERAAEKYGDVKYPAGGTVGAQANHVLFSIRDLAVGREAPDIEGEDQDGKRFKLSDYRGKVVLLYFWNDL